MRVEYVDVPPVNTRYEDNAFDRSVGAVVPLKIGENQVDECTIVSATVIEGGYAVRLVIDLPDWVLPSDLAPGSVSVIKEEL
jgi:hypothetical protein